MRKERPSCCVGTGELGLRPLYKRAERPPPVLSSPPSSTAAASLLLPPPPDRPSAASPSSCYPTHPQGRMTGRKVKGARGSQMPDADPKRSRAALVSWSFDGKDLLSPEVPSYILPQKKAHSGKKGNLNGRRSQMKAKMAMRSGTTGHGCVPGTHASIVYVLSEEENQLLYGMRLLALGEGPVLGAQELIHN
ncbi:uncharacterized protein LOC124688875 [Lolium rigidum]|uniref:uncharacterized protein LOC124688875 n=1 Tax=Lolium rigidum TaxID=89674 RepID=UPI001F5D1EB3|nr:uncharacterized protein LOC124688875 [Lolium rigidum]XP_047078448.1 uncharacterized protein LOC124688875 [Lolium rigidum]